MQSSLKLLTAVHKPHGVVTYTSVPDTAVPVLRTVKNVLQHLQYKFTWVVETVEINDQTKWKSCSPMFQMIPGKISPLFQDNQWYFEMEYSPCDEQISFYLCANGIDFASCKCAFFNLCFEISIFSWERNEFLLSKASGIQRVDGDSSKIGWKKLCSRSCIQNSCPLHLRATIWTLGELNDGDSDITSNEPTYTAKIGENALCHDVGSIWNKNRNEWADMVIDIGRKSFPVHRAILAARSPIFREMFKKQNEDSLRGNYITLDGIDLEPMELMLEYIYTGQIGTSDMRKLNDLLELADKLDVESCKTECFHRLSQSITLKNALELAEMADTFDVCTTLKDKVNKFCLL